MGKDIATILARAKKSKIHFHPETDSLQDSGYQGIKDYHSNSYIPRKKPKNGKLSLLEKDYNRAASQERIVIEHVNRSLKIFKILRESLSESSPPLCRSVVICYQQFIIMSELRGD